LKCAPIDYSEELGITGGRDGIGGGSEQIGFVSQQRNARGNNIFEQNMSSSDMFTV
jgi:hypothetical protein